MTGVTYCLKQRKLASPTRDRRGSAGVCSGPLELEHGLEHWLPVLHWLPLFSCLGYMETIPTPEALVWGGSGDAALPSARAAPPLELRSVLGWQQAQVFPPGPSPGPQRLCPAVCMWPWSWLLSDAGVWVAENSLLLQLQNMALRRESLEIATFITAWTLNLFYVEYASLSFLLWYV